jgi:penicillin-binding protein-related factor A (putative recombinase)
MRKKLSESDFAKIMGKLTTETNGYFWSHKWEDKRYCPFCHSLLYKSDSNVDYTIIAGNVAGLVECKQDPERFYFSNDESGIRPNQREFLNEWSKQNRPCFLFLELGDGSAPKERQAWLIPWVHWLIFESKLEERGMKSLPWKVTKRSQEFSAIPLLWEYELEWVKKEGFHIPENHIFFEIFKFK